MNINDSTKYAKSHNPTNATKEVYLNRPITFDYSVEDGQHVSVSVLAIQDVIVLGQTKPRESSKSGSYGKKFVRIGVPQTIVSKVKRDLDASVRLADTGGSAPSVTQNGVGYVVLEPHSAPFLCDCSLAPKNTSSNPRLRFGQGCWRCGSSGCQVGRCKVDSLKG